MKCMAESLTSFQRRVEDVDSAVVAILIQQQINISNGMINVQFDILRESKWKSLELSLLNSVIHSRNPATIVF